MFSSLQFPAQSKPVSRFNTTRQTQSAEPANTATTPISAKPLSPLSKDVFFSGKKSTPSRETNVLYELAKDPKHCLSPEEMHKAVIDLLSRGADPHYVDPQGKTAAEHMEKLKLYTDKQFEDAQRQHSEITACGYDIDFNITHYISNGNAKPLPKTVEVLREWAVNQGAAQRDDAASTFSESTPLLRSAGKRNQYTFRR